MQLDTCKGCGRKYHWLCVLAMSEEARKAGEEDEFTLCFYPKQRGCIDTSCSQRRWGGGCRPGCSPRRGRCSSICRRRHMMLACNKCSCSLTIRPLMMMPTWREEESRSHHSSAGPPQVPDGGGGEVGARRHGPGRSRATEEAEGAVSPDPRRSEEARGV